MASLGKHGGEEQKAVWQARKHLEPTLHSVGVEAVREVDRVVQERVEAAHHDRGRGKLREQVVRG